MPVTASCFLDSAIQFISSNGLKEADYRTIVSRAYYGAYHAAKSFAEDTLEIDVDNIKGPSHITLSNCLANFISQDKDMQKQIRRLGTRLHIFHALRVRADYKLDELISEKDAQSQIKNSSELLAQVDRLSRGEVAQAAI